MCKDVARFDLYPYQITSNQTGSSLYVQRKVVAVEGGHTERRFVQMTPACWNVSGHFTTTDLQ